jgi:hypothetical protein
MKQINIEHVSVHNDSLTTTLNAEDFTLDWDAAIRSLTIYPKGPVAVPDGRLLCEVTLTNVISFHTWDVPEAKPERKLYPPAP